MQTYKVFRRACRNFEEFSKARKYTIERGLSYDEARRRCEAENAALTEREKARGVKYEFTKE